VASPRRTVAPPKAYTSALSPTDGAAGERRGGVEEERAVEQARVADALHVEQVEAALALRRRSSAYSASLAYSPFGPIVAEVEQVAGVHVAVPPAHALRGLAVAHLGGEHGEAGAPVGGAARTGRPA
jgi:hypothetical protein